MKITQYCQICKTNDKLSISIKDYWIFTQSKKYIFIHKYKHIQTKQFIFSINSTFIYELYRRGRSQFANLYIFYCTFTHILFVYIPLVLIIFG